MSEINELLVSCLEQRRAHCFAELKEIINSDKLQYSEEYHSVFINSDDEFKSFNFKTFEHLGILIKKISEAKDYTTLLETKFEADELAQIIKAITIYGSKL